MVAVLWTIELLTKIIGSGFQRVKFLVNTIAEVSEITVKTTERGGGEIVGIKRLFTGANGNMLHLDGKMQLEMISAWGQKVSSTVCVTMGAASNLQGLPK